MTFKIWAQGTVTTPSIAETRPRVLAAQSSRNFFFFFLIYKVQNGMSAHSPFSSDIEAVMQASPRLLLSCHLPVTHTGLSRSHLGMSTTIPCGRSCDWDSICFISALVQLARTLSRGHINFQEAEKSVCLGQRGRIFGKRLTVLDTIGSLLECITIYISIICKLIIKCYKENCSVYG